MFVLGVVPTMMLGCADIDLDELAEGETAEAASPMTYVVTGLGTPRRYATATLLGNGKVLVAGGSDATNVFATAEVYDPATDQWSATPLMTGSPPNRYLHTATLITSQKVMVVGGNNGMGGVNNTSSFYDANTNTWSAGPSMSRFRYGHTATTLQNGRVLVVGGYGAGYHNSAEIYNPTTNSWSNTTSMSVARFRPTATLLDDGRVLVVGGTPGTYLDSSGSSDLYDSAGGTRSSGPNLKTARYAHTATKLSNGCVLIIGGVDTSGNVPGAERWCPGMTDFAAIAGNAAKRVEATMTTLSDNRVLVAGGHDGTGVPYSTADIYDPATNTWQSTDLLQVARSRHAAVRLNGDRVLFIGGSGANTTTHSSVEISRLAIDGNLGSPCPTSITGTTCGGKNDFAPSCASSHNEDRAYLWTAPRTGHYQFTTVDSAFTLDTVLYVQDARTDAILTTYNGSPACNDNTGLSLQSTVLPVSLVAGQRVQAIVDGYGPDRCGSFKLSVSALCQVGLSCNTGQPGVCAAGTTQCNAADSTQACVRNTNPGAEVCGDNLDNDCDGLVDEGCGCERVCLTGTFKDKPCISAADCKGALCDCPQ